MSFQAVRRVFEEPVINALAALTPPVTCYVANQEWTNAEFGGEYAVVDLQWGQTNVQTLGITLENLQGSLVVEAYTDKNAGPGRAQEIITPVRRALNDLNTCGCNPGTGAVGFVGQITGPAFIALDDQPFFLVRISVEISAQYN